MTDRVTRRSLLLGAAGAAGAGALTLGTAEAALAYPTRFHLEPISKTRDAVLHGGKRANKRVWLTFDDHGSDAQVKSILATLWSYNVRAVFFPTGDFARYHPALIRAMHAQGHIIGNHSYSHPALSSLSNSAVKSQIDRAATYIKAAGGLNSSPKLFRCPYGDGAFTSRINNILAARGYQNCYWTVDTRDWSGSSAATIVRRVRYGDQYTPPVYARGVVLMHMHGKYTGTALPGVIRAVRARGLVLPRIR